MQNKEKLEESVLDKLKTLQSDINLSILALGDISLKRRDLQNELNRLNEYEKTIEASYDKFTSQLDEQLSQLQLKYPDGEIDLSDGTITYNVK